MIPHELALVRKEADAILMRSAPELLTACKYAREYIEEFALDRAVSQYRALQEAINKAEGTEK